MKKTSIKMETDDSDNEEERIPDEIIRMFRELWFQVQALNVQVQHLEATADQCARIQGTLNDNVNVKLIEINRQLLGERLSTLMVAV